MAGESIDFGPLGRSAVREMANIGLGHAATALAGLTGKTFSITVPEDEAVTVQEIATQFVGENDLFVGTLMPIAGDTPGHIAFLMSWESAQALWGALLGAKAESPTEISEMHVSTMLEIGNILDSSFLAAISDLTGLRLESTPPRMSVDTFHTVIQDVVCEAEASNQMALAVRTRIIDEESAIDGFFVFLPSYGGLRTMFQSLGLPEAA